MENVREGQLKLLLEVIESKKEELRAKENHLAKLDLAIQLRLTKISTLEESFQKKQITQEQRERKIDSFLSELSALKRQEKMVQNSFQNIMDQLMLLSVSIQEKAKGQSSSDHHRTSALMEELEGKIEAVLGRQQEKLSSMVEEKIEHQFKRLEENLFNRMSQREDELDNWYLEIMKKESLLKEQELNLRELLQKLETRMHALGELKKSQAGLSHGVPGMKVRNQKLLDN